MLRLIEPNFVVKTSTFGLCGLTLCIEIDLSLPSIKHGAGPKTTMFTLYAIEHVFLLSGKSIPQN